MPRGGPGRGQGRKAGIPNKSNKAFREAAAAAGLLPVAYMLEVMRNPKNKQEVRLDAAAKAAPYLHSRMPIAITHQGNADRPITHQHQHRMIREVENITVLEAAKMYEDAVKNGGPLPLPSPRMKLVKG